MGRIVGCVCWWNGKEWKCERDGGLLEMGVGELERGRENIWYSGGR